MNKLILKVIALSITAMALLTSCDNQESLQQYFVGHQETEGFISTSIPKTITGIDENQLSPESAKAYRSVDKINVLALPMNDENRSVYATEVAKLDEILNDEKYELLMSHNDDNMKIKMIYDGTQDAIDEIIVYGRSEKLGFGIARVLGKDMNVGSIMSMMQELDTKNVDAAGIKDMLQGFGIPVDTNKSTSE
ncbi:DUF4252 domain-containing protein [Nonlabens antarcticus]|uniref:DUF4252 domain-containing protein n=1 Tax=Nonlabens antarcticus TaxID=392714 RepID=UPI0018911E3D|nr:DUF4252 domain-containing protein [Nonlabens antarcticus]